MRLISFLLLITLQAFAFNDDTYSQSTKIDISIHNASLEQVIWHIKDKTEFSFFYNSDDIKGITGLNVDFHNSTIKEILEHCLENTGLDYEVIHKTVIIRKSAIQPVKTNVIIPEEVQQPVKEVKGIVNDADGNPMVGVTVVVKGTTKGVITDTEGRFSITLSEDEKVLAFSFVGFLTEEIEVGGQTTIDVTLVEDIQLLDQVVVVGYGQQKKVSVTGSISSVSSDQLTQSPVANISNSLSGRASGVLAVQRSGEPGEDQADIRIRGIGTFAGSQNPLILVDGVETSSFNNIDPNEIENVSILKDASSTAVYGVRGANGVIIITTKRGKKGKPSIKYSSNVAATSLTDYRERMRAYDYTRLYNEALRYDSYITGEYTQFFTDEEIELYRNQTDPIYFPDIDWIEMMFKDVSLQHQHNLNFNGGTDAVKYFVSVGMFSQEAQFNNTDLMEDFFDQQTVYKRYNFRSNFDFNVTKRLDIRLNLAGQIENKRGINANDVMSLVRSISMANPIDSPGLLDGKLVELESNKTGRSGTPFNQLYSGHRKTNRNNLEGTLRFEYDLGFITKGLSSHASLSFENNNMDYTTYNKPTESYKAVRTEDDETVLLRAFTPGAFSTGTNGSKKSRNYIEAGINYARGFTGGHNVTGLILYNQQKSYNPNFQFSIPIGYQGLVGRVTYDYKSKYLIEYNAGYNGTENFAPGKRFGFFPAYSLGWIISEESFFPENNIVSFFKLRGSYGVVGNDKIGGNRFLYLPSAYTYEIARARVNYMGYYWGEVGSTAALYRAAEEGKIGNPDVTWERAKKANAGIEITFFNSRLRIIADVFEETRDNILMNPNSIPSTAGMGRNVPAVNQGIVENRGFDGELSFNDKIGDFHYWVRSTYTFAKNKIIFKDEVPKQYDYLMETGLPIGTFFGRASEGLFNNWEEVNDAYRPFYNLQNNKIQPGDIEYIDVNGDGIIDQFDNVPLGYPSFPEINYGVSLGCDWRGFDLSVLFQGASHVTFIGHDKHVNFWNNWQGNPDYLKTSWSQERYEQGLPINFPRYFVASSVSDLRLQSSYYAEDASYIRLKNFEIGYLFDNLQFVKNLGIESARIYANGSNLWTWAYGGLGDRYPGVDPEDRSLVPGGGQPSNTEPYPRVMVLNLGINVNF